MTSYAELQVTTNFSFLRGASHADELAMTAASLGISAIGVTDRNTLSGVVRMHGAAKRLGLRAVIGSRLDFMDGTPSLLVYPIDRPAYGRLARLLTTGQRRAEKGQCHLTFGDLEAFAEGQMVIALPPASQEDEALFAAQLERLRGPFKKRLHMALTYRYAGDDKVRMKRLARLASSQRVPLVATNDIHAHVAARRPLQDVLTCIREHTTLKAVGFLLHDNAERHLKAPAEMARLFSDYPDAITNGLKLVERCTFSLDELRYEYPIDPVPQGTTPQKELERLSWEGAKWRYRGQVPDGVKKQVVHELALIRQLNYAPYFLTVHDIVQFARNRGILCQGRGSAANSAVCYCLGITAVDPARIDVLFERFISAERDEPPDIDVDFEHERREEVIQYVYNKYGRERAGLAAAVTTYRRKSALREIGKVFGLAPDTGTALAKVLFGGHVSEIDDRHIREAGLDPTDPVLRQVLSLAEQLSGFPRHLSQHSGGMVMTKGPLCEVVPIGNAAMEDRTVIEWDKNDLDTLGMLKIDVLALGMLSCIRRAFALIADHHHRPLTLASIPSGDKATYDMLSRGDSVGVFQVESRAQMAMLPRLRPQRFYDLVIEVAIVRPGPIQGKMVHPYLRRRNGEEAVSYPSKALERVLSKTLGVPLFQEQAMQIAIVGAGFTPSEADGLRRAMATFRNAGTIHAFEIKFIGGMIANGYDRDFAERCFNQIRGFADYGFPESHAASFALLVYVSAWLKRHYPAAFAAALINSQPMGFYAPAQIVRDAQEHGVEVRPVDVSFSDWDCTLEEKERGGPALRLGLRQVKGLSEEDGEAVMMARGEEPFASMESFWRQTRLTPAVIERLAKADAFNSVKLDRRGALWEARALNQAPLPLFAGLAESDEPSIVLPPVSMGESVAEDFRSLRLSLKAHPVGLLREGLAAEGYQPCGDQQQMKNGQPIRLAGMVITRQRPGTAKGIIFVTLEDETGIANLVVYADAFERYRRTLLTAGLMGVEGRIQREGQVIHVTVSKLMDLTERLRALDDAYIPGAAPRRSVRFKSRDFQ